MLTKVVLGNVNYLSETITLRSPFNTRCLISDKVKWTLNIVYDKSAFFQFRIAVRMRVSLHCATRRDEQKRSVASRQFGVRRGGTGALLLFCKSIYQDYALRVVLYISYFNHGVYQTRKTSESRKSPCILKRRPANSENPENFTNNSGKISK